MEFLFPHAGIFILFLCRESLTQQDFFCLWSCTFTWMLTQENTLCCVRAISSTAAKVSEPHFENTTRQTRAQPCTFTLSGARLDAQVRLIVHIEKCIQLKSSSQDQPFFLNCPKYISNNTVISLWYLQKDCTLIKGCICPHMHMNGKNWPAHWKQCAFTCSRGLSDPSPGTAVVVVVLLSLPVAADAGDMMTTVPKPGHGIGLFPNQGETYRNPTTSVRIIQKKAATTQNEWKRSKDSESSRHPPGGQTSQVPLSPIRESYTGHCDSDERRAKTGSFRDVMTTWMQCQEMTKAAVSLYTSPCRLCPRWPGTPWRRTKDDRQRHVWAAAPTSQCK